MRRVADPERHVRYEWEDEAPEGGDDDEIRISLVRARLPRVTVMRDGVVTRKTCSIVQLLKLLDSSVTVQTLSQEEGKVASVPALPERTLLVEVHQYAADNEHVVTGWIPPGEYPFLLQSHEAGESFFRIGLPALVYRARWSEASRSLLALSLALAPNLPEKGAMKDKLATPLYRYPFSNVYENFRGTLQGVCWATMHSAKMALDEVPERAVRAFLAIPNNLDLYGRGLSHAAPHQDYAELLGAVEKDGLPTDWLIPTEMTPEDLHRQKRPEDREENAA